MPWRAASCSPAGFLLRRRLSRLHGEVAQRFKNALLHRSSDGAASTSLFDTGPRGYDKRDPGISRRRTRGREALSSPGTPPRRGWHPTASAPPRWSVGMRPLVRGSRPAVAAQHDRRANTLLGVVAREWMEGCAGRLSDGAVGRYRRRVFRSLPAGGGVGLAAAARRWPAPRSAGALGDLVELVRRDPGRACRPGPATCLRGGCCGSVRERCAGGRVVGSLTLGLLFLPSVVAGF